MQRYDKLLSFTQSLTPNLVSPIDFSGEGHGNSLQYSYLENLMDGVAW